METKNNIIAFTGNLPRTLYRSVLQWKKLFQEKYGEFGISHISLGNFSADELKAEIESPPFLIEKKLVIISVSIDGNTKNSIKFGEEDFWASVFSNTPNETTVVLYGFKPPVLDSAKKTYTRSKKTSTRSKKKETVSQEEVEQCILDAIREQGKEKKFELLSISDFKKYIQEQLPKISITNAELLIRRLGNSPESIENEVQKLALASSESISSEIIIENTRENSETSAFEVLDMLIAWNTKKAYELIKTQLIVEDGMSLLRWYIGALRKPALYCALILGWKTASIALKISGIHEYAWKKYFTLSDSKKRSIVQLYLGCIQIDTQGKTWRLIGDSDGYEHGILSEILAF
jgi:DNA polymerase III delta subunit